MKHKTAKLIALGILVLVVGFGIYILSQYQHTSSDRLADQYAGDIEQVKSSVDIDNDGVDDQTDILDGALEYIKSEPKYKSKYYSTGYPDDGYGVCTDLVASALKSAGYDLMLLVNEDILANPENYDVEEPDANIDYRRVGNLNVFFANNAISLTTDVSETREWQGGDIVIYKGHIGIVSDRRNAKGVPYVIHHNDPWQDKYEEDILETRAGLVGHYRMSE